MRPHYPDTYECCINGCDSTLCEILQVNISRTSPSSSTSSSSNTQSYNRNTVTTNQNIGEIISMNMLYLNYFFNYMPILIIFIDTLGHIHENNVNRPTNNFPRNTNTQPHNTGNFIIIIILS